MNVIFFLKRKEHYLVTLMLFLLLKLLKIKVLFIFWKRKSLLLDSCRMIVGTMTPWVLFHDTRSRLGYQPIFMKEGFNWRSW